MILLYISLMMAVPSDQPAVSNPAAWIAVLRQQECVLGRSDWTWQELCEAREAVLDSDYAIKTPPRWLNEVYLLVLRSGSLPVILITLAGIWLVWIRPVSRSWRVLLCISLAWMLLSGTWAYVIQPQDKPAAIIKMHGIMVRQGNGLSYPPIFKGETTLILSAGVEANYLAQRSNGWVQLQLDDGTRGWVPLDAVYLTGIE